MRNPESITVGGEKRLPRRRPAFSRIATLSFLLVGIGALIAAQIVNPTKRVIEAAAGVLLVYVIWSSSTINALWILLVAYPFPFGISIGNSTFIFIILIFLIYLVRVSAKLEKMHFDRRFNMPIVLFLMSYVVSFYNASTEPNALRFAFLHMEHVIASILLFYMIVNFVDTEERLAKTMRVTMITATAVIIFTILEMIFPGRKLIPGWLYTEHKTQLVMKDVRLGGPFHDYELVAEYFAMNVPIIFFMLSRSRRLLTRSFLALLFVADIIMLFSTMTRGAFISLMVGLLYMAWACRRDLNFVKLTGYVAAFVTLIFFTDLFVARYTISGSLFGRILGTTFESGFVPDTRVIAWGEALKRGLEHPIIGNGPGWDFTKAFETGVWPHSLYLFYFNVSGLFGLCAFLFLLWRLWRASTVSRGDSVAQSSYPRALLIILNVSLLIFIVDQIKIDYPRNDLYGYFVWSIFGLIAAARNLAVKRERARPQPGP